MISLITSPITRALLVAGAILMGLALIWGNGASHGRAEVQARWDAANRAAAAAAEKRDVAAETRVELTSETLLSDVESELRRIDGETNAYLATVSAQAGECLADRTLLDRMRKRPGGHAQSGGPHAESTARLR